MSRATVERYEGLSPIERRAEADRLMALADEVQRLGNRISDIERDALDRDLVWPTRQVEQTDALARQIRAKAMGIYCPHNDATKYSDEHLGTMPVEEIWECDNCGQEISEGEALGRVSVEQLDAAYWRREHGETQGRHFGMNGPMTSAGLLCPICRGGRPADPEYLAHLYGKAGAQ